MEVLLPRIAYAFGLLFGVLLLLLGLLLVAVGWSTLWLRLGQRNWTRVPAEVLASRVVPRSLDDAPLFQPKVSYRFMADGGYVTSERLALAEKSYHRESQARRILEKYPVGTTVMASYPPDRPEDAVLEPGGGLAGLLVLVLGLALVAAPLLGAEAAGLPGTWIGLGVLALFCTLWLGSRSWRRRERAARRDGLLPPPGGGSDADVARLLGEGEKLLAVHLYREIHGTDLKTSLQRVNELAAQLKPRQT